MVEIEAAFAVVEVVHHGVVEVAQEVSQDYFGSNLLQYNVFMHVAETDILNGIDLGTTPLTGYLNRRLWRSRRTRRWTRSRRSKRARRTTRW